MRARLPFAVALVVGLALGVTLSLTPSAEASRNSSGTYALPSGNPVVSGTTITTTWANATLGDISTELTDSLSRSGKGAMLAPLKLAAGTSAAPALSFDADPDSGLYRVGAGSVGLSVDSTQAQRWTASGSTLSVPLSCSPGACSFPTGITTANGVVATNATTNGGGLAATGNGTGVGVSGTGGGTSGYGVLGTGGAPNGYGVVGVAVGTGYGVEGRGGVAGAIFSPGTAATASARTNAAVLYQGDLSFSGVASPNSNTAISNTLTPTNVVKAWGKLTTTGGGSTTVTVAGGFNVTSATTNADGVVVTLASAFTSTNYMVMANGYFNLGCYGYALTATTVQISCFTGDPSVGTLFNFAAGGSGSKTVQFMAIGAQ